MRLFLVVLSLISTAALAADAEKKKTQVPSVTPAFDDADKTRAKIRKMTTTQACEELGRLLRIPAKKRPDYAPEAIMFISERFLGRGDTFGNIAMRVVEIGMSECGLIASLGRADRVNETVTRLGTRKQFVYEGPTLYNFIYTENGTVTSYQR